MVAEKPFAPHSSRQHRGQKHSHGELRNEMLSTAVQWIRMSHKHSGPPIYFYLDTKPQENPRSHLTLRVNLVARWHRLETLRLLAAAAAAVPAPKPQKKGIATLREAFLGDRG